LTENIKSIDEMLDRFKYEKFPRELFLKAEKVRMMDAIRRKQRE
jgi:hypothetical protein